MYQLNRTVLHNSSDTWGERVMIPQRCNYAGFKKGRWMTESSARDIIAEQGEKKMKPSLNMYLANNNKTNRIKYRDGFQSVSNFCGEALNMGVMNQNITANRYGGLRSSSHAIPLG